MKFDESEAQVKDELMDTNALNDEISPYLVIQRFYDSNGVFSPNIATSSFEAPAVAPVAPLNNTLVENSVFDSFDHLKTALAACESKFKHRFKIITFKDLTHGDVSRYRFLSISYKCVRANCRNVQCTSCSNFLRNHFYRPKCHASIYIDYCHDLKALKVTKLTQSFNDYCKNHDHFRRPSRLCSSNERNTKSLITELDNMKL